MSVIGKPKREKPVELGPGKGCVNCCSQHCDCIERQDDGSWKPDDCDWCRTHGRELDQKVDGIQATYRTNP